MVISDFTQAVYKISDPSLKTTVAATQKFGQITYLAIGICDYLSKNPPSSHNLSFIASVLSAVSRDICIVAYTLTEIVSLLRDLEQKFCKQLYGQSKPTL